jgi:hypothetical protein
MKVITAAIIVLCSISAFAQNSVPSITNLSVSYDDANKKITVNYDLSDNESDNVEIIVSLSDDYGGTFLAEITNLQGDAGYPVTPGTGKQVTFNYNASVQPAPGWIVKVTADDRQPVDIQQMVNQVDSVRLRDNLSFISGIRHYQADSVHLEEVKDFIENRFRQHQLLNYRQNFIHNDYHAANIIGWRPGVKNERVTYIIDAHFDSVNNSPGADDNGSGMAGVLEAARILSQYQFEHTIKFIGFDFEETSSALGGLTGSLTYVSDGIKSYEQIKGVFNFEMIGYYSDQPNTQQVPNGFSVAFPAQYNQVASDSFRGNFVVNTAIPVADTLKTAFDNAAALYVPALKVISITIPASIVLAPDFWRSDHASFWFSNYPAIMLTDGANFRNLNYHTPNDTIGAINFTFMSNIVKATVAAAATLAKPVHASSAVAYLMETGVKPSPGTCHWQSAPSSEGITFFPDKNCGNSKWNILLFDTQGKAVFNTNSFSGAFLTVDSHRLPPGLYFFVAQSGDVKVSLPVMMK